LGDLRPFARRQRVPIADHPAPVGELDSMSAIALEPLDQFDGAPGNAMTRGHGSPVVPKRHTRRSPHAARRKPDATYNRMRLARPRKDRNPIRSVTKVTKTDDDTAGSRPNRSSVRGASTPAR